MKRGKKDLNKERKTGMVMGANITSKVSFELMLSPDHAVFKERFIILFFTGMHHLVWLMIGITK